MTLFASKMFMDAHKFLKAFLCCLIWFCNILVCNAHDEFIDVIAVSKPAVVSIEVTRTKNSKKKANAALEALGANADFFADDLEGLARKGRGSGFIFNYDHSQKSHIFILTAAHVVRGASKVNVVFQDSKREKAEVFWLSRKDDIALLKVKAIRSLSQEQGLELDSQPVVEGQGVLAIAGSFDLSISSSVGIVSAVDIVLPGKRKTKLIQTDAAVNPGSSGGPLLNAQGKVIGLISNIYTKTGSFSGAAFAIPATMIKKVVTLKSKNNN